MDIVNIINLAGGLGLFLFGMRYMSDGINQVAGTSLKRLLEKLTNNRFKGFLLGLLVTTIIQSSSATTVMLMGFLNAGIMTLLQASAVILGAHIGTTITAVLIAIDVSAIAPICIFIGIVMIMFCKKSTKRNIGQIILGFGILFFGLKYMSGDSAMGVLKTSAAFKSFIMKANNPLVGLLVGGLMCAILQSSSASIGVLQALALQGLMPMNFAIYLIIGVNVGSAMPLLLSSIGAKTNAKRAAFIYFIFDVVGMLIFTPLAILTPYTSFLTNLSANGSVQVASGHIIFKVVTAIILLPFVKYIVKLSETVIKRKEHDSDFRFLYIDPLHLGNTTSSVAQVSSEIVRMAGIVRENLELSIQAFNNGTLEHAHLIRENEEKINWLNSNISDFAITLTAQPLSPHNSEYVGKLFHVLIDLERIGDHAMNILERTERTIEDNLAFSEYGMADVRKIYDVVIKIYDLSIDAFFKEDLTVSQKTEIQGLIKETQDMITKALDDHVVRLREGICHTAQGVIFTKLLQDLDRTGDHSYNIAKLAKKDKELISQL